MRTFYQSAEYENMADPGKFARLMVIGDDDGPHFMFRDGDEIIIDLPLPVCDALAIHRALDRSIDIAMRAAEQLTPGFTEAALEQAAEPRQLEPPAVEPPALQPRTPYPLEPGMTPYGRRELDGPEDPPEPVSVPHTHVDHTRALPVTHPARLMNRPPPLAIHPGQQPLRRTG